MLSFSSVLERVRQKPEAVRARYLLFSVGVSFVGIVALWAFSLQVSMGALLRNGVADTLRESARSVAKDAPVSLEDLMKTGKTLQENGEKLRESATSSAAQSADLFSSEESSLSEDETAIPSTSSASSSDSSGSEGVVRQNTPEPKPMSDASPSLTREHLQPLPANSIPSSNSK